MWTKKQLNNYYKTLCEKNVDVKHEDNARKRFFSNPDWVPQSDMPNEIHVASIPPRRVFNGENDNVLEQFVSEIWIFKPVPKKENYDGQDEAVEQATTVLYDFLSRIKQDRKIGVIKDFNLLTVKVEEIGPFLSSCYGIRAQFYVGQPNNFPFVRNRWTDGASLTYPGIA